MSLEVDVRKLALFNQVAKEGSRRVADSLSQLAGIDAEMQVSKINFLDMDDVKDHIGDEKAVGIYVELLDPPYGYVLTLLAPRDSKRLARSVLPDGEEDKTGGLSDMERSAIKEIANIVTSGYIDGWANILQTSINMGTPTVTYRESHEIVQEMGGWPDDDISFVLDSTIIAGDTDVDMTLYTFPRVADLVDLVQRIDVDTDVEKDSAADERLTDN